MNKNTKIIIISIIVVIIVIVGIIFLVTRKTEDIDKETNTELQNKVVEEFVQVMDDGLKVNTSTKLNETKNVNGLEIGNIKLTMENGTTTLIADVKNNTGKDLGVTAIDIILLDKTGAEIITFGGVIGEVKVGESVKLEAGTTLDFANAYDFKVVIQ